MMIRRAALGRKAHLGDLYDASTDTFCNHPSPFRKIPKSLVTYKPRPRMTCNIRFPKTRYDRCRDLGLSSEEQLSVIGLQVPLSGSAEYLAPDACTEGDTTASLICQSRLFAQKLSIYSSEIKQHICLENARNSGATHFVSEIEWGANSIITINVQPNSEYDAQQIAKKHALRLLVALAECIRKDYAWGYPNKGSECTDGTRLELYTDFSMGQSKPETLEGCALFVGETTRSLQGDAKDIRPIMYTLFPLSFLDKCASQIARAPQSLTGHDDSTKKRILDLLEKAKQEENALRQLYHQVAKRRHLFPKEIRAFTLEYQKLGTRISSLMKQIAENIITHRLGTTSAREVQATVQAGETIFCEVNHFFMKFNNLGEKLRCLQKWEKLGAHIVTNMPTFQNMLTRGEYFVFFTKLSQMDERFAQNCKTFEKLCQKHSEKCIVFDDDLHQTEYVEDHSIVHYLSGYSFEDDMCRLDTLLQDFNVIKIDRTMRENTKKRCLRAKLQVACPRSFRASGCDSKKRDWICYHCGTLVEYGFNKLLYCECGESDPFSAVEWCCNDPAHGVHYADYKKEDLAKELEQIQHIDEINVLLVGETGAGKSTWINSIANYVIHDNLMTAAQHDLIYPIPSSFTIQMAGTQVKKITVGSSNNENFKDGQAATQEPRTYTFMFRNKLIRLIDTPGVCDTRGPEQDKKNFDLILREMQTIKELHAICILLAPDTARLGVAFQYCINELLTHLHKSAAKNIVFCFTKTRATFYKAGQTLPVLQTYLAEFGKKRDVKIPLRKNNMYYFDNEAFRLLCAIKNNIKFSEREQEAYQESWNISARETMRFLKFVLKLKPHLTREMLSLNEARRMIVSLTVPLTEITENINTNLRVLKEKTDEMERLKTDVLDLEKHLHITQITLKAKSLQYPQTVCMGPNCTDSVILPGTGEKVNYHKKICHGECYLKGIEPDKFPDPKLKNCNAMGNGKSEACLSCGCRWELHLHRVVEHIREEIEVTDNNIQKLLEEKLNRKIEKEDVIAALNSRKAMLEKRRKRITEICASFGAFLYQNSIVPYNDAMKQYLEYAISMAEQDACLSHDRTKVDSLNSFLERYLEELGILKASLTKRRGKITAEDVMKLKEELYSMNSEECNIATFLKTIEEANDKHYSRQDQHLNVEQLATKGRQKKDLLKLNRTKQKRGFLDWIGFGSKSKSNTEASFNV